MFEMKNVIAVGDYKSKAISARFGTLNLNTGGINIIALDKRTVRGWTELPEPRRKNTHAIYIAFKDGKRSIVDVNEKVYQAFTIFCPQNDKMKLDEALIKDFYK